MWYHETRGRSIAKTISWRVLATLTTIALVYLFTGTIVIALEVGVIEVVAKLLLFFFHERMWNLISWGKIAERDMNEAGAS